MQIEWKSAIFFGRQEISSEKMDHCTCLTSNTDVERKWRCLEEICLETWKSICKPQDKWNHHRCEVLGCSEGYNSVDGLEKVCRTTCAAPKEKFHASK